MKSRTTNQRTRNIWVGVEITMETTYMFINQVSMKRCDYYTLSWGTRDKEWDNPLGHCRWGCIFHIKVNGKAKKKINIIIWKDNSLTRAGIFLYWHTSLVVAPLTELYFYSWCISHTLLQTPWYPYSMLGTVDLLQCIFSLGLGPLVVQHMHRIP